MSHAVLSTVLLLVCSNVVMTFAWLTVFVPFAVKLDFLWAGLCLLGAVYFIFRES